jgi:serine/threonine protein kinase
LVAAHAVGVLHRDVKPDNVLLADDGRVVLGDFGLASVDTDGKVTRTGQLGTPQYVAPERARHGLSSREADLWSLGATLYAAVEGRSPYGRESVLETLAALAVDEPDPMRLAGPLAPILSGLLRRNPADRTQPEALAEQLRKVIAGEVVLPPPMSPLLLPPGPERPHSTQARAAAGRFSWLRKPIGRSLPQPSMSAPVSAAETSSLRRQTPVNRLSSAWIDGFLDTLWGSGNFTGFDTQQRRTGWERIEAQLATRYDEESNVHPSDLANGPNTGSES